MRKKNRLTFILLFVIAFCFSSCENKELINMSSENGDGYIVIVWDERKYIPYCVVSKKDCGEQIGILDGDASEKICEYKDHSCNDWIVNAPDYDGGAGIGYISDEICELQKMYCVPEVRGKGVSHKLIKEALEYAKIYYKKCYLETFENMVAANIFYLKYGFYRIDKPVADTGHYACDRLYIKDL